MAKPNSIPVRKRSNTTARPIIPISSFPIFSSGDLYEVTQKHEALHETADTHGIYNGIKGQLQGDRDFVGSLQIGRISEYVPAEQKE
jgi:hypothetical protein